MILADAMAYVQEHYEIDCLVDICTLTGAICVGLGTYTAGLFGNDEKLVKELIESGGRTRERCWHMPIEEEHEQEILDCKVADLRSRRRRLHGGGVFEAVREGRSAVGALGYRRNGDDEQTDGLGAAGRYGLWRGAADGLDAAS